MAERGTRMGQQQGGREGHSNGAANRVAERGTRMGRQQGGREGHSNGAANKVAEHDR